MKKTRRAMVRPEPTGAGGLGDARHVSASRSGSRRRAAANTAEIRKGPLVFKVAGFVAVVIGVAGLLFFASRRVGDAQPTVPGPGGDAVARSEIAEVPAEAVVPPAAESRVPLEPLVGDERLVVDESGAAIEGASAYYLRHDGSLEPGPALGVSDAAGRLRMRGAVQPRWNEVVVLSDRHVPTRAADHVGDVTLQGAYDLAGLACDRAGNPVAGVKVVVSKARALRRRHDVALAAERGLLFDTKPTPDDARSWLHGALFAATTGADGSFRISGLPRGTFRIDVSHDAKVIVDNGVGGSTSIDLPRAALHVVTDSPYRASIRIEGATLSTARMLYPQWASPSASKSQSVGRLRETLQLDNAWTGSRARYHVFPGVQGAPLDASARFTLFFHDAPMRVVDVPVRPLEEENEMVLAVASDGSQPVETEVVVRDATGAAIVGARVSLYRDRLFEGEHHGESYTCAHGERVRIPAGTYDVSGTSQIASSLLTRSQVTVAPGAPLVVEFKEALLPISIACDEFSLGECDVYIMKDRLRATTRVADGEPPSFLLPAGSYRLWVSREGMHERQLAFEVERGMGERVVAVPRLEPKR